MPIYFKGYQHDEYRGSTQFKVASMEDIENLKKTINKIDSSLENYALLDSLSTTKNTINKQLNELNFLFNDTIQKLHHSLESGKWKHIFKGEVEDILKILDEKYVILGEDIDKRKNELTALLISEQNLLQVIQLHEIRVKQILEDYVNQFVESIKEKNAMEIQKISFNLIEAAKNITWK